MITQLLRALNEPLLVEPTMGARLVSVFGRKMMGTKFSGADLHAELGIATRSDRKASRSTRIGVVPVFGMIAQHPQSLGSSTEEIVALAERYAADPEIDAILYDHDSPGGTVPGVPEAAAMIRAIAARKPSLALANSLSASASYWLAAAAGEVWVTPSGESGSIGVWTAHEDWSKWFEQEGISVTEISAGEFKTEGAPWKPLTKEAKAVLQDRVDEVYGWFVRDVAKDRGATQTAVREGYGQARVLGAEQSVKAGLADRVGTFEEAVARLSGRVSSARKTRASRDRERLALDADRLTA